MDDRLSVLVQLLKDQGDAVLNGAAKLSLQLEEIVCISKLFDKHSNEDFVPCQSSSTKTNIILDFIQKTKAIKIVGGESCDLLSLKICKSLRYFELYNVPVEILCDVECLMCTVRTLALNRSCSDLSEFLSSKDSSTVWKKLTKANFCFNNINIIFKPFQHSIPFIRSLDLSHNDIRQLDNALLGLKHLETLKISFNLLEDIPMIDSPSFKSLVARNNNIKMLDGFYFMKTVIDIDLRGNCLEYIEQLSPLAHFSCLEHLYLSENPIAFNNKYRTGVLKELNHKINADKFFLDSVKVSLKEYDYLRTATTAAISVYSSSQLQSIDDVVISPVKGSDSSPLSLKSSPENKLQSPKKVHRVTVVSTNDDDTENNDVVSDKTSEVAEIADSMVERYGDKWLSFFEGRDCNNIVVDEDIELEKLTRDLNPLNQVESSDENSEESDVESSNVPDLVPELTPSLVIEDSVQGGTVEGDSVFEAEKSNPFDDSNPDEMLENNTTAQEDLMSDMISAEDEGNLPVDGSVTKGTQHFVQLNGEDVFLLVHESVITELDSIGQALQRLDISCLENFLEDPDSKTIKMYFNHVSLARKQRLYQFNTYDEMYSFLREIEDIWRSVRDTSESMKEVMCINCSNVFPKSESTTCSQCASEVLVPYTPGEVKQDGPVEESSGTEQVTIRTFVKQFNDSIMDDTRSITPTESSGVSSATTHTDYSLYSGNKTMFINQTNFVKADHKLELFFDVELFIRENEVLCCFLFAQYVQYGRQKPFDCVVVVSNHFVHMCKLRPNDKPALKSRHRLSQLKHLDIGLNYQHFRLEWEIKDAAYKVLVFDRKKCKDFIDIFTLALPKSVQLNQVSTSTIKNIQELVFGVDRTFELFAKGKQYRQIMKTTAEGWGIRDRMYMFRTYEKCFIASELVDLMISEGDFNSRAEAVDACHQMLLIDVLHHVKLEDQPFEDDTSLYRFSADETGYDAKQEYRVSENLHQDVLLYQLCLLSMEKHSHSPISLIISNLKVFFTEEYHQWPLPRLQPPLPMHLRGQHFQHQSTQVRHEIEVSQITMLIKNDKVLTVSTESKCFDLTFATTNALNDVVELLSKCWNEIFGFPLEVCQQ